MGRKGSFFRGRCSWAVFGAGSSFHLNGREVFFCFLRGLKCPHMGVPLDVDWVRVDIVPDDGDGGIGGDFLQDRVGPQPRRHRRAEDDRLARWKWGYDLEGDDLPGPAVNLGGRKPGIDLVSLSFGAVVLRPLGVPWYFEGAYIGSCLQRGKYLGLCWRSHWDLLPLDLEGALRMELVDSEAGEKGSTDVQGVDQSLENQWPDAELGGVIPEGEVDSGCLAKNLHRFPGSSSPHRQLRHGFQLIGADAKG